MGDYQKAAKHFREALKHINASKDPALWNLASGLVEFCGACEAADVLSEDHEVVGRLEQIERLLRDQQKAR